MSFKSYQTTTDDLKTRFNACFPHRSVTSTVVMGELDYQVLLKRTIDAHVFKVLTQTVRVKLYYGIEAAYIAGVCVRNIHLHLNRVEC